jgi:hypothetical protein
MGGRERLRPNRGLPVAPGTTRDPTLINRCGERNERFIDGSVFGYGLRQVFWALHLTAVRLWGGYAFSRVSREAPVRTEPLPTIRVRFIRLNQRILSWTTLYASE